MSTLIHEELFFGADEKERAEYKVYVNGQGDIYIADFDDDRIDANVIVILKEDWQTFKKFIDQQLKKNG